MGTLLGSNLSTLCWQLGKFLMCRHAQFVSWPAFTWHRLSSPLLPARLVAFASSRIIPNYIEKASIACHCFWPLQCNFLAFLVNQNFVAAPGLQFTARPESFLPAISNNCLHLIAAAAKEWEDGEDGNGGHAGNSTLFIWRSNEVKFNLWETSGRMRNMRKVLGLWLSIGNKIHYISIVNLLAVAIG